MAQNICNICGANYEYKNGRWICPACGAYKPEELSNEEVTLLYNASQKIRLALFDDAEEQYKDIVAKYPDNPDGYWGLVLAKYGIKYEQDYDGKMIPSCYAASYESVLTDKNYLKAIELADKDNKKYYEEQANKIEKIRKEWIDKASKEEPYDIFISYKDTEKENGTERTKDSYDALELYTMLSKLGYRVFYSRESLKDKAGEKYEPYIFNALNTAHIMIVYGSKPEYIESTWIKNEWMRFYKRIKLGKKQPNALLVINNGFNPAELPQPLNKMQTLDRNRLDFSRELESYCKRVIKAATTVLPKIERVEVKAKQGKVGKIVKIEAVELNNKTAQKTEIVREEVEKREIGNYTVSKLTANAENELKIAEMQLSTANFDEAGKRFNTFLLKNPKNGRALTGKLLADNKSKDLDGFSSIGVQSFADWKLLEQVLLFSEKSVSEKILKALCDEILRSFNTGDYVRARDVYSQVSAYEDSAVTEMRKSVCDLAKGIIDKNDDTAKYFIDGYLLYEKDEDLFLFQISDVVDISIWKSDFNFAKKYSEDWLKYENTDLSANYSALKIKYKVKTIAELFAKIEFNNAYSEIDGVLHCLNEESAAACFKDICDRVNTLLNIGNSAKQVYSYIDKFFRYNFNGRFERIEQLLHIITNNKSKELAPVFDLLLTLSDFNTEEYSLYTLRFADNALKNGDFDLADKYYDKVNELHETALSWEGKLKCRLKVKNDIEYSANIQNLTDFKIIENILSLSENDGKRYEFLSRIVGYVYSALKTSKTDTAKLVAVFEYLLSYVPKDFDDKIIEWLFKFARFLKNNDEFDLAEKLYAIIINYDAENHIAYWEMLQAKLHCKDEQGVIKQYNLISDFQEFQNALLASANNDSALRHYIEIQNKQKAWIEQDKLNKTKAKKRKKIFKVACIMFAVVVIAIAGVFGGLSYYNSENILKYNSVDGGLSVYAGKFYKADETLIIPQAVDGKTVTEISANAFENHTEIKKVIIPTTVNAIRESAFSGCVNLESVEFSNVAKTNANTQTSANENNGISLFSAQTFNAVNFATVNNNDSIKLSVIGARAFKGCEKLKTFELNYGLKTIGEEAFSGSGLKEIAIPETVEFVGKNVFENCNSLTVIEVGDRDEIPQNWDTDWNKGQEVKVEFSVRVVFDYNGADRTIKAEQYVVYDKSYNFPVPTKEGYTFVGWYRGDTKLTGKDGVSLSDWNYTDGGTVKAEFTANENTLFFNGNGATSGDMQSQKIHTAENVNLNTNGFTKAGYTFTGWSTSANGTKVYNDGALYTMGKNSSYVLYAVWQANTNTLRFNANGGSGTMSDRYIQTDETKALFANEFARNGYDFVGWSTEPNGTKVYNDKASYTMGTDSEYTLYALWSIKTFSITYNLNNGILETENPTEFTIETDTFTLNNPKRSGYTFTGWSGTDISGTSSSVSISKGSIENRSYTANWQIIEYTVSYSLAGGSVSGNMTSYTVEDSFTLINPTCAGYTFIGWSGTEISGTAITVTITKGSTGDREYTANWQADYFTFNLLSDNTYEIKSVNQNLLQNEVIIPQQYNGRAVTKIGEKAFENCTSLTSIKLSDSLLIIGRYAFSNCSGLENVILGENITSIGEDAFYNCSSLINIAIPNGIVTISNQTFRNCINLTSITIPANVVTIGSFAFYSCDNLTTVFYKGTEYDWSLISINSYRSANSDLIEAKRYYYSENYPDNFVENTYWHYVNGEPTVWIENLSNNSLYKRINSNGVETDNGNYILFGEYPQTIKADNITITNITDSRGYYLGSDGDYYAALTANPWENNYKFSNGNTVVEGNVYYFKVEPIKWRILTENNDTATLLCEMIIDINRFDDDSHDYASSEIRAWLINNFYNTAFNELQKNIINDNSFDNLNDKIYILSMDEVTNNAYGFSSNYSSYDTARKKAPTDYAIAHRAFYNTDNYYGYGTWWTRTPSTSDSHSVWCVYFYGRLMYTGNQYTGCAYDRYGVVPAIQIRLNSSSVVPSESTDLYKRVNSTGVEDDNGDYILFGEYPQSMVTDSTIKTSLNSMAGSLPTSSNNRNWTSYGYYYNGSISNYMWYIDLTFNGEKYRGVYFTQYRPRVTGGSSSDTCEDDNGYVPNTIYWFKWEPIKWQIIYADDGTALLLCDIAIDSQQIYVNYSNRTIDGSTIYSSNYEYSDIRKWLNESFYELAFTAEQRDIIQTVLNNNSASSTNPKGNSTYWNNGTNNYSCKDTYDNVFLFSVSEITNTEYGYSNNVETQDDFRQKYASDYAKSQGCGIVNGYCNWWTRSSVYSYRGYVRVCNADGSAGDWSYNAVYDTNNGVVPALWIKL